MKIFGHWSSGLKTLAPDASLRNARGLRMRPVLALTLLILHAGLSVAAEPTPAPLSGVRRVVFLGDSITYSGQYIEDIETYLRLKDPAFKTELLDLGLPSETVSGLSEPGHAGGQFPRPCLLERLDRVLEKTRPDLLVVCYGMNDGIYYPFGEARFQAFQDGIKRVREKASAAGAKVLHVTPPVFDPLPLRGKTLPDGLSEYPKPFEGYDAVLARYSRWLLDRKSSDGWDVVDAHGPMARFLAAKRKTEPGYVLAGDGVHSGETGHWLMARVLLEHWGIPSADLDAAKDVETAVAPFPGGPVVLKLVRDRQRLLKDAWLSAVGHKRPGMKPGLSLADAEREAVALDARIRASLAR